MSGGESEAGTSTAKIEIRLSDEDLAYFDALRGEISRKRFGTILLTWAMEHPEEAFKVHFNKVKGLHGRGTRSPEAP